MSFSDNLKLAFEQIEKTNEFKNIDTNVSAVFYTLYTRCKRTYHAILALKESNDSNVTYIEVMPSLRVLLENFFHLSYVMREADTEKVRRGYELLTDYSHRLIARKMKHLTTLANDSVTSRFVSMYEEDIKLPKEFKFLDDIGDLAGKTNKRDLYRKHYSVLNSFIHFNPSIFKNYGTFKDGKFMFNAPNEDQGEHIYGLIDNLILAIVIEITTFLRNDQLENGIYKLLKNQLSEIREKAEKLP